MSTQTRRELAETVRKACVDAAQEGYLDASMAGLCHEGAWEAAISAIRMVDIDALVEQASAEGEPSQGNR